MSVTMRQLRHELSKTPARVPLLWIRHRGFRQSDVFLGSYPRSGSTWLRFLLSEILTGQSPEFNRTNELIPDVGKHNGAAALLPSDGRLIKTHESYRPEYKRAVYLVRDARDVVSSEYAYQTSLGWFKRGLDDYLECFVRGAVDGYGSWQEHVSSWVNSSLARSGNLLVLRFEDLRRDPVEILSEICNFLAVEIEKDVIKRAIDNNSLERMREKEKRNPQRASRKGQFVRSGLVEGWRGTLSEEQVQTIERYAGEALSRLGYACGEMTPTPKNSGAPAVPASA